MISFHIALDAVIIAALVYFKLFLFKMRKSYE